MNKKLIYLLMLVFTLGLSFTACSDDDDDESVAQQIAGTYSGELNITGLTSEPISNNIVLSKVNDNTVKMSVASLDIPNIGTVTGIDVKSVSITKSGNTYTLTSKNEDIEVDVALLGGKKTAKVKVDGTVSSNGAMSLSIVVTEIQDLTGMTLPITFAGTKK
ncbi:calycin-like domain-containing protein [Dysgonomonas sp. 521]|uniref:calycin-like domain-containing protein n=1 Tax=Dysgonomonas sp. 521 TaxID=2302932 RepID=UPI0013D1164D|nr:calycin-like domain-containing protein [Dysgonomonas sp. 521]